MTLATLPIATRTRFIAWSAIMLAMLATFTFAVLPRLKIETDILALLPTAQQDRAIDSALSSFSSQLARKQLFLVGAQNLDVAKQAATAFANALSASKAFLNVQHTLDADLAQRFEVYAQHRGYLLASEDIESLRHQPIDTLTQRAIQAAYSPAGLMQPLSLSEDPSGLLNRYLAKQLPSLGNAQVDGSVLVVNRHEMNYVLLIAETDGSPFAATTHERVLPAIDIASAAARAAVLDNIDIVTSGAVRHAAAATQRATQEISIFGSIELICVIALLWSVFGRLRPLGLGAITLGLASVAALSAVHFMFGTVHLPALVFGSSLIGGVIDYSVHFFADRFRDPKHWTPVDAYKHVGGAILLGLITTLIGYVVLVLVPFPGLKQIAVFCAVGLITGCGCVLCLYPVLGSSGNKPPPAFGARIGARIDQFLANWRWTQARSITIALLGVFALLGLSRIHIQDDIRALQQSPADLLRDEQRVRQLLSSSTETRFFVITGDDEQALLSNERTLTKQLDALIANGALGSYQALSHHVPTLLEQDAAHRLLAEKVYSPQGLLPKVMRTLGFADQAIAQRIEQFAHSTPLTVESWLESPASEGLNHLWLGKIDHRFASVVTLGGISDVTALNTLAGQISGVRLIDRVAGTTAILGQYRRVMSLLLVLIYMVAGVVLTTRFGWRDAPRMLLPSALATALTLGLFGWFGVPINLFTLLALWLVLGMGIDYGIFLRHGATSRPTAILSVTLSACTTLLAFGLLSFSATPFIRSIGLTLLCAIMLSWLIVLFSCLTGKPSPAQPAS